MYQHFIEGLQRLGRALMLPIAILPIAGLLLRLGDTDLLNIAVMHDAGQAIFANLALIFAIGIAVGFARDNNGTAGLAGAIGYLVMVSTLKVMDTSINMGMLAGIASGLMAGALYNRFKDIKLPEYLAFFGGRRFVPIVTGFAAVALGALFGLIWPPIQEGINSLGVLLLESGSLGAFMFGHGVRGVGWYAHHAQAQAFGSRQINVVIAGRAQGNKPRAACGQLLQHRGAQVVIDKRADHLVVMGQRCSVEGQARRLEVQFIAVRLLGCGETVAVVGLAAEKNRAHGSSLVGGPELCSSSAATASRFYARLRASLARRMMALSSSSRAAPALGLVCLSRVSLRWQAARNCGTPQ